MGDVAAVGVDEEVECAGGDAGGWGGGEGRCGGGGAAGLAISGGEGGREEGRRSVGRKRKLEVAGEGGRRMWQSKRSSVVLDAPFIIHAFSRQTPSEDGTPATRIAA